MNKSLKEELNEINRKLEYITKIEKRVLNLKDKYLEELRSKEKFLNEMKYIKIKDLGEALAYILNQINGYEYNYFEEENTYAEKDRRGLTFFETTGNVYYVERKDVFRKFNSLLASENNVLAKVDSDVTNIFIIDNIEKYYVKFIDDIDLLRLQNLKCFGNDYNFLNTFFKDLVEYREDNNLIKFDSEDLKKYIDLYLSKNLEKIKKDYEENTIKENELKR